MSNEVSRYTIETLREQSEQFKNIHQKLVEAINAFVDAGNNLLNFWEGDNAEKFRGLVGVIKSQNTAYDEVLRLFEQVINEAIEAYNENDNKISSMLDSLS